jgi:hypothetical protein
LISGIEIVVGASVLVAPSSKSPLELSAGCFWYVTLFTETAAVEAPKPTTPVGKLPADVNLHTKLI